LLPLIGAQVEVIAFATPLVFCLFAGWRCLLAARRNPQRATIWVALGASVVTAAAASIVALVYGDTSVTFYIGAAPPCCWSSRCSISPVACSRASRGPASPTGCSSRCSPRR
jgi:hypothetical protein